MSGSTYFLFVLFTATIGPLLYGYHLAELNAPSEVITCEKRSISRIDPFTSGTMSSSLSQASLPQCIKMNPTQFGAVTAFFTLGGLLGALAAGAFSPRNGRARTMLLASCLATIGPVFEAMAPNIGTMTFGRFVAGFGAGGAMVVTPIYIFDISPPGQKGFYGSFTQVMVNLGILITQVLGYFLSKGQLWRTILGVGGAIGLIQALSFLFTGQESPKWVAECGKPGRAKQILRTLRGQGSDIDAEIASWNIQKQRDPNDEEERLLTSEDDSSDHMQDHQSSTTTKPGQPNEVLGFFGVLKHPDTRPAVIAVCVVMTAQQFTGINSVVMYGVSLLSSVLEANSALLNVAVSALNVVMTIAAAPLVEKAGRKASLLISTTGMGTFSIVLAIGIMRSIPVLSAIAVLAFVASFALGLGPVPWLLAAEFVNSNASGATQSWALVFSWVATFIVAQFFPVLNEAMPKGSVYYIFAAFAVAFGVFTVWFVPESKGKKDADEVWGRGKDRERVD